MEWKTCHTQEWLLQSGYHQHWSKFSLIDVPQLMVNDNNRFMI